MQFKPFKSNYLKDMSMRHLFALSAVVAAAIAAPASAAVIDLSSLNLAGSAALVGGQLQLTNATSQSGAGWVQNAISTTQSFSTSFSFSLLGNDSGKMADGIALAFQNAGNNVTGNGGGDVGYWNIGGKGSAAVGSVIRSWDNNDYGLSTNGVVQGLKQADFSLGAANNVSGSETVSYNAVTHELTMSGTFVDNKTGLSYAVSDSKIVDLSAKFGSTMYVGFTGGTGGTDAIQKITAFSVSAVPEPATYAMLLAGLGIMGGLTRRRKAA
ncbi:PEP-CTERM sorting domain-containing protein [Duganella callida]|uniref:PEP-CTERM sorting domain-containing protein n=1 Tax=Duganella callida TaxID=2561932 RepID=A0A4Y9S2J8_9BURK|nr:PEP-CTERM sorting domain-containing protein [Duganella callida]TFW15582.1 PEP-CTERM sorting domain-containing protein [Duganella callida]